jgi:hypothetical protein
MKTFIVQVEIEMAVVADDASDAEDLARRYLRDEDTFAFSFYAREIKDLNGLRLVDSDLADCHPWGSEGDKTLREIVTEADAEARKNATDVSPTQGEVPESRSKDPFVVSRSDVAVSFVVKSQELVARNVHLVLEAPLASPAPASEQSEKTK